MSRAYSRAAYQCFLNFFVDALELQLGSCGNSGGTLSKERPCNEVIATAEFSTHKSPLSIPQTRDISPDRLAKVEFTLKVSEKAQDELAKVGFDPVFGARPLKRAIQPRIENPLSKLLLEGKFAPKDVIAADVDPIKAPGQFSLEKV